MDPTFHITTPRLYISHFQPSNDAHCDFLVKLWNTPEFIASCGQTRIRSREDARKEISGRFAEDHKRNGYGMYLVSSRCDEDGSFQENLARSKPIGTVSLMRGKPPNAFTAPDLGFAILPEEMRKGYTKEAAQALMVYVEEEMGVKDVLGLFNPENEASKGVFRSLGFQDCGVKVLEQFGGVPVAVWVKEGMSRDVSLYGL